MKHFITPLTLCVALLFASTGVTLAAKPDIVAKPVTTGQPNKSCQNGGTTPGNAAAAPGSAFNTSGVAGTHYAGTQPQNSKNPNSVSQYDVAFF